MELQSNPAVASEGGTAVASSRSRVEVLAEPGLPTLWNGSLSPRTESPFGRTSEIVCPTAEFELADDHGAFTLTEDLDTVSIIAAL